MERYIYLEVTSQGSHIGITKNLKFKFYFHFILTIAVHFIVFWEFPLTSNYVKNGSYDCNDEMYNTFKCNNFEINHALQVFYVIYLIYFIISAFQIKNGAPRSRAGEFVLMKNYNTLSNILFIIYHGLPFLYEIRTLLDWTFTATTLTLFQWFKFEEIYASLYNTKCDQIDFSEHPRGQKLGKCDKLWKGCCFLVGILLCILAPLIIFSSLNPIVFTNPVKNIELSVGIKLGDNNFYELSRISIVASRTHISQNDWNDKKFNQADQLSSTDSDLMDAFTLSNASDNIWLISNSANNSLCDSLNDRNQPVSLQAKYTFFRDYPADQQNIEAEQSISLTSDEAEDIYSIITGNVTEPFSKKSTFSEVIRLLSAGTSLVPILITDSQFRTNIHLTYADRTWSLTEDGKKGLTLYIISERYSPVTFNFSVITFYVSVVYLIGRVLRVIVSGSSHNIPLSDMPNPDPLINLCRGIYLSRMSGDLYREEMLYYELIDILRSPEIMKMLTGTSSIKKKEE